MNFLEQLAAEWYEYRGYLIRRNIRFGGPAGMSTGGHSGEIDVLAFMPGTGELVHLECSSAAATYEKQWPRFQKTFELSSGHYAAILGITPKSIRRVAILYYSVKGADVYRLADGNEVKAIRVSDFIREIAGTVGVIDPMKKAIPETFPLLRAMQHGLFYGISV